MAIDRVHQRPQDHVENRRVHVGVLGAHVGHELLCTLDSYLLLEEDETVDAPRHERRHEAPVAGYVASQRRIDAGLHDTFQSGHTMS